MNTPDLSILIVEDEPIDAELLQRAFKRVGLENPVRWVMNGEEAVGYMQGKGDYKDRSKHPYPRVIMTDIKMPQMDGLEFLRWMHETPQFRVVPIIILTSSARQADIDEAFKYGASAFMVKPIGLYELDRLVKLIVDYWSASKLPGLISQ